MRILVCGSRTFDDEQIVTWVLDGIRDNEHCVNSEVVLIEGGARGADALAKAWVDGFGTEYPQPHEQYPADWGRNGKRAGFVRNQQMLDEGRPDVVVAFVDQPLAESKGTAMMVDLAKRAGLPTYVIEKAEERR